jgi:hypothetical protein
VSFSFTVLFCSARTGASNPLSDVASADAGGDSQAQRRQTAIDIATENMLQNIGTREISSRDRLEAITEDKWKAKCALNDLRKCAELQLAGNTESLEQCKATDAQLRAQLATMNEEVVTLEKFIRASTRLQSEATAAFNQPNANILAASNMLRKRYADSRSPSAQAYIALLKKHFTPTEANAEADPNYYSMFDVMAFYSEFYDSVHLPRDLELHMRRNSKLGVWRQLVACVTDTQNAQKAMDELNLIIQECKNTLDPPVPVPGAGAAGAPGVRDFSRQ